MKDKKLLECLFGHHDYSKELVQVKGGQFIHLCKICGRSGYYRWSSTKEVWYGYDEEGNCVHRRWSDGYQEWYNKRGDFIRVKYSDGS